MLNISRKQGKTAAPIVLLLTTLLVSSSSLVYTNVLSLLGDNNNNSYNNVIYAQTSNSNATSTTPQELPGVKITFPTRGQQIPIGNTSNSILTIKGVSTSNANSQCGVYIIIDGIKPYQKTLPTGQRGPNDYSTWKYQLNNGYAAIKPGSNKLTSKISCAANPTNFTKSNSINVTGMAASTGAFSSSASKQLPPQTIKTIAISNNKSNNNNNLTQNNSTNNNSTSSSLLKKEHDQQEQQPSTISQQQTPATPSIRTVNDSRNGGDSVSNNSGTISKPEIKITSPAKGQQVPASKDLLVSGTSASNATSPPDCKVSVKVNGISPYQVVSPSGAGGRDDYSKWNFTLTPAYTTIREGQNKITAKFSCSNNPSLVSRNSVNVTGVSTNANTTTATTEAGNQQQQRFSSENNNPTPSVLPLSSPNLKLLSVSTNITKNPINRGDSQIITVTASDGISNERVIGATVDGKVIDTNGLTDKEFRNTTDANGQVSYSWPIDKATKPGLFVVQYNVTADGFKPNSATSPFNVQAGGGGVGSGGSSSSGSSSNSDHHHKSSTAGEGNSRHFNTGKTSGKGEPGKTSDNGNQGGGKGNEAGGHGQANGKGSG